MKKCSTCGSEFTDDRIFCSNCGTKLGETPAVQTPDQEAESAKEPALKQDSVSVPGLVSESSEKLILKASQTLKPASVLPIVILSILAFCFLIAAVLFCFQMYDYSRRLDNSQQAASSARRELGEIKSELAECQNDLEQAQIDLELAEKELKRFDGLRELYGYGSENYYAEQSVVILQKGESKETTIYFGLSGTLSMTADAGITSEWSREWLQDKTQITITGNSTGYFTINFTNDQNSDSFKILVIVTDK